MPDLPGVARVLDFWLNEVGPKGWYAGGADVDARVTRALNPYHAEAQEGGLGLWLTDPRGTLAYLIVTDQAPRNMFRGSADAFGTDALARSAALAAITRDWDLAIDPPARQFFYLPLEHAEDPDLQDRAVALFGDRLPDPDLMRHARAHRAIIRRFGRFPTRNAALGRIATAAEADWLAAGGYGAELNALDPAK